MSAVALAIGLVVGNLPHPGSGLDLSGGGAGHLRGRGHRRVPARRHPDHHFSALTNSQVLHTLLVALLVGFAIQAMGRSGEPILRGIGHLQRLVFRVLAMIMWAAPIGAFGAIAAGTTRGRSAGRRPAQRA